MAGFRMEHYSADGEGVSGRRLRLSNCVASPSNVKPVSGSNLFFQLNVVRII